MRNATDVSSFAEHPPSTDSASMSNSTAVDHYSGEAPFSSQGMDRLLRAGEVQEALGMSGAKVYRMMQRGILPTVRVGGSVRVPLRALFQWIEDNTRPGRKIAV